MINQVTFDDSKDIWKKVLENNSIIAPFLTWEWHNDWFNTLGTSFKPLTIIIDDSVVASFARKGNELIFSGGDEIADYLDIIGENTVKTNAWNQIIHFVKSKGISKISIQNIPENSATRTFFESTTQQEDTTPIIELPSSWEIYIESLGKKYTHELERKIRKFDREHPDSQIIESTNPSEDISILFDLMEKDDAKKLFLTSDMKLFFTTIATTFSKNISLRYVILGDKKISATLSFVMNNTYYLYNSGFDKDCCSIAGFYLKAMNIKHAIEQKAKIYNFLQGNERYKYELGGKDFAVYSSSISLTT